VGYGKLVADRGFEVQRFRGSWVRAFAVQEGGTPFIRLGQYIVYGRGGLWKLGKLNIGGWTIFREIVCKYPSGEGSG